MIPIIGYRYLIGTHVQTFLCSNRYFCVFLVVKQDYHVECYVIEGTDILTKVSACLAFLQNDFKPTN